VIPPIFILQVNSQEEPPQKRQRAVLGSLTNVSMLDCWYIVFSSWFGSYRIYYCVRVLQLYILFWICITCYSYEADECYEHWCMPTRGDQKVLQFSMMYKWHRQNDYIICHCNLHVHQYTFHICQKVFLFQSNRIPGAGCRDTAPWPATAHHHQKTSFCKGAASEVEISRSCWVSGRASKVGETAAQIRCPWLWPVQIETCVPEHYRAATADLGSEFPSASPSLPDADLSALHRSMIQSLLSSVVCNPQAAHLCNPKKLWSWLSNQRLSAELPGRRRVDVFPLRRLLDGVWIPVVNPCFITSYYTGQHVVRGCTVDSQQLQTCFHPKWLLNGCQKTWGPSGTDLAWTQMFKQNIQDDALWNAHFCGYLQDFQSSIARHELFDSMATIISGRFDWPSS